MAGAESPTECQAELEPVVSLVDVLEEDEELENEACAVLGGSDSEKCSYSQVRAARLLPPSCLFPAGRGRAHSRRPFTLCFYSPGPAAISSSACRHQGCPSVPLMVHCRLRSSSCRLLVACFSRGCSRDLSNPDILRSTSPTAQES